MDLCTCSPSYMLMHPRSACSNRLPTAVRRLCRVSVCCIMLWHWPGWCCSRLAVLWVCVAVCCRVFQCIAVCFSVLQCFVAWAPLVPQLAGFLRKAELQCVAVCGLQIMTQGSLAGRRLPSYNGHSLVHFLYYLFV